MRKRPGMYIGSTGERGLHHLIWEIVDNAVDEALAGHCDRIVLTLLADGGVRVEDNGRGIPTDTAPGQELPAVTMALTVLHAGGKFGGGGYKVSGGLHGVGVSVVNALSQPAASSRSRTAATCGARPSASASPTASSSRSAPLEPGEGTGTTVTYWASTDIFETTTYSLETITTRIREMAFLNKGLEIVVRDERPVGRRGRRRGRGRHRRRNAIDQAGADAITARRGRRHRAGLQVRPRPGRLRRAPQPPQGQGQPDRHHLRGRDAREPPRTT